MKKIYNKLVRDYIPEEIMSEGKACLIRRLDDVEYLNALRTKLREEYNEWTAAMSKEDEIEELADMMEIIHTIDDFHGGAISRKKFTKHDLKGGFYKRIHLEYVIENDEEDGEDDQ